MSLAEAREGRETAKKRLDAGQDPMETKKLDRLELQTNYENNFENLAREWHAHKIHTWKPIHAERILSRLGRDIFPKIGARPICDITAPELLDAVRRVEARGNYDLAHRVMQTCGQVFRYAVATGRAEKDITQDLKGALKPAKSKTLAYLSEGELPTFLKKLDRYEEYRGNTLTKLAFKFLVLTFVRSGEIRGAKWDEINWEKKEWRIPADRMKMKEQHIVPLAPQAIAILKEIHKFTGDGYSGYQHKCQLEWTPFAFFLNFDSIVIRNNWELFIKGARWQSRMILLH